jgi:coniferyl-aldehyde dehydrogenase
MLIGHRLEIQEAMHSDFGVHPPLAADLIEVLGPAGRAGYAAEQLDDWMADEPRYADPALFGSGRAFVRPQPKGVIGNIVPWNFPFDLSVGPLIEMLAAGNRVVIKPSEYTPACGELLQAMVRSTFDRDRVDVVVGGVELARAFTRVRWDHLLYTGSPAIGREIAKVAAEQLVPVTLELGGKCPAILAEDSVDAESVKQVLGTKALKNGQMCISVDYCLVPRSRLEDFARLAADYARDSMPGYCHSDSCTGIISTRHLERIEGLLADAQAGGADVRMLEEPGDADPARRQLPLSLVIDPPDSLALMREEIFGPILPVKPYDELEEAIAYVNEGERPLALYVFAQAEGVADDVLRRTTSGGACVNSAAVHGALPSLPFGGIGQSGSGRHHGVEGFREFSNLRGVFVRGEGDLIEAFAPPYGPTAQAVVGAAFQAAEQP